MPLPRHPHVASLDEVHITRDEDTAIIAYADERIGTTHFKIGPALSEMTDEDVLDCWNASVRAMDEMSDSYDHVATEMPPGRPQLRYSSECDQWVPRGDIVRCEVLGAGDDPEEPFVAIDGRDFTPREFVRMVSTFGGWGMRLAFVPRDDLHEEPEIQVREPADE